MTDQLAEKFKMFLIKQNLQPRYTAIVASHCPQSVSDIMRIAREVETTRVYENDSTTKPKPKFRGVNTVQQEAESSADSESDSTRDSDTEKPTVAVVKTGKHEKKTETRKSQISTQKDSSAVQWRQPVSIAAIRAIYKDSVLRNGKNIVSIVVCRMLR